jgi:hypothetical protein
MHRLALFTVLFVVVVGCASRTSMQSSDGVYDNRGGLAYGGLRIIFRASSTYEIQQYSDVKGDDSTIERGTYQKQDSAYVLSHAGGRRIYRIVTVRGVQYLLDSLGFDDYSRTRDPAILHTALRKVA